MDKLVDLSLLLFGKFLEIMNLQILGYFSTFSYQSGYFFLIISIKEYISPSSVFVSSSIFLFTPSLVEMSAFQLDIPVRSTGFILLGIALYFYWIKDSSIPEKSYAEILNPKRTSISVICLTACAACYQPIALMFVPGFLLISLFNGRLCLTNIRKGTIICIVSFMSYFLLWRFLLLFYDFGLGSNEGYDILVTENITMLSKFVEIFNNFIDFIILPKNSMPAFVSVFLTLLSAQLAALGLPEWHLLGTRGTNASGGGNRTTQWKAI